MSATVYENESPSHVMTECASHVLGTSIPIIRPQLVDTIVVYRRMAAFPRNYYSVAQGLGFPEIGTRTDNPVTWWTGLWEQNIYQLNAHPIFIPSGFIASENYSFPNGIPTTSDVTVGTYGTHQAGKYFIYNPYGFASVQREDEYPYDAFFSTVYSMFPLFPISNNPVVQAHYFKPNPNQPGVGFFTFKDCIRPPLELQGGTQGPSIYSCDLFGIDYSQYTGVFISSGDVDQSTAPAGSDIAFYFNIIGAIAAKGWICSYNAFVRTFYSNSSTPNSQIYPYNECFQSYLNDPNYKAKYVIATCTIQWDGANKYFLILEKAVNGNGPYPVVVEMPKIDNLAGGYGVVKHLTTGDVTVAPIGRINIMIPFKTLATWDGILPPLF